MVSASILSILALAATALGAPAEISKRAQTVYLAGDSTMATGNANTAGWGGYLAPLINLPVVNKAIGGRSSRSFTVEGRFKEIVNLVQPNDIVIMCFGHNDGGGLGSADNGRAVCAGTGAETCKSTYNGQAVTVHTFNWYMTEAGKALIAKGAKVIVSSPTARNPWQTGSYSYSPNRFVGYARDVANALGSNAMYVDHSGYTANRYKQLGKAGTDPLFPNDALHNGPKGADVAAKAFVKGISCAGGGFLKGFIKSSVDAIEGTCL